MTPAQRKRTCEFFEEVYVKVSLVFGVLSWMNLMPFTKPGAVYIIIFFGGSEGWTSTNLSVFALIFLFSAVAAHMVGNPPSTR